MNPKLKAVERDPAEAVCSAVVKAGTGWLHEVRAGQILRIVDLCGNQSADVLLYNAHDTAERYNVNNTIAAQRSTLIELGTELRSNDDNVMFTVVADTCNLNFFTKVQLGTTGSLEFVDGISGPGKYVDLEAKMDVLVLLSNCAQLNNPCNDYNPTPVQMLIWDAEKG